MYMKSLASAEILTPVRAHEPPEYGNSTTHTSLGSYIVALVYIPCLPDLQPFWFFKEPYQLGGQGPQSRSYVSVILSRTRYELTRGSYRRT